MFEAHQLHKNWFRSLSDDQKRLFWVVFFGFNLNALAIQLYALILPVLMPLWQLRKFDAGMIAGGTLIASALGSWLGGTISDRIGRVVTLRVSIVVLMAAATLSGVAQSFEQMMIARILQGLAFGAEWSVGIVLISEAASPASRARTVGVAQSGWPTGWALALLVVVVGAWAFPVSGWRLGFLLAAALAPALFFLRGHLVDTYQINRDSVPPWHALFWKRFRPATKRGVALTLGLHSSYWTLATWLPGLLLGNSKGLNGGGGVGLAFVIMGAYFGYFGGSYVSDRAGRTMALKIFAFGGMLTATCYFMFGLLTPFTVFLGFLMGICATALFSASGPLLAELYPTELRGAGQGFCFSAGRAFAGTMTMAIGWTMDSFASTPIILTVLLCAFGLIFVTAFTLPETRSSSLDFDRQNS